MISCAPPRVDTRKDAKCETTYRLSDQKHRTMEARAAINIAELPWSPTTPEPIGFFGTQATSRVRNTSVVS